MQWSLFLLILLGQYSLFTCRLYEYHFVEVEKSWDEAQEYCRDRHTDLATVVDMTDVERLRKSIGGRDEDVWIGLHHNQTIKPCQWYWSLPGMEFENRTNWYTGQPDCSCEMSYVALSSDSKWHDIWFENSKKFICYDAKNSSDKFHLIQEEMNWLDAQSYCRQNHTDLVNGLKQVEDEELTRKIRQSIPDPDPDPKQGHWMIGLSTDKWRWSDGSQFSFRHWKNDYFVFKSDNDKKCVIKSKGGKTDVTGHCAMTTLNDEDKWETDDCDSTKSFVCYDDKVILIKENKTWDEALNYCREHHRDLASITDHHQQIWIQEKAKNASTEFVWLGLRYTCTLDLWFWVSDEAVSYKNWASSTTNDDCDMSGAIERGGEHKWVKKNDAHEFNFICSKC